jgi:DNA polymerase-3 subunit delta
MDSLAFLQTAQGQQVQPVYVLHGDEEFLKRQVLAALRLLVLESEENSFGLSCFTGDQAVFATIHDELATLPFIGRRRLVVVESADHFVTNARSLLEKYVNEPTATGVLVLVVKTFPPTTRLAKLIPAGASIQCKALAPQRLPSWCTQWALAKHGKKLSSPAAQLLVDLVGTEMGLLDQELDKLAVYVGSAKSIEADDVNKLVGSSRAESTWKMLDAIGTGQPEQALRILGRLFDQGEEPIRMLGAFSLQLRRLAQLARLMQQGMTLAAATQEAGIPYFAQRTAEQQLRHVGRQRTDQLYEWLLEADLGLKGSSQLPPRIVLERLVVRLARKA